MLFIGNTHVFSFSSQLSAIAEVGHISLTCPHQEASRISFEGSHAMHSGTVGRQEGGSWHTQAAVAQALAAASSVLSLPAPRLGPAQCPERVATSGSPHASGPAAAARPLAPTQTGGTKGLLFTQPVLAMVM